jgi:hypothetical protein
MIGHETLADNYRIVIEQLHKYETVKLSMKGPASTEGHLPSVI